MKKKILIGSILAVVILVLVSFTGAVGYQTTESSAIARASPLFTVRANRAIGEESKDCNCIKISLYNQIMVYKLLERLQFIINIIKLRLSNNPNIVKRCSEVTDIINSSEFGGIFCDTLYGIITILMTIALILRFSSKLLYFIIGTIAQNLHVIYDIFC